MKKVPKKSALETALVMRLYLLFPLLLFGFPGFAQTIISPSTTEATYVSVSTTLPPLHINCALKNVHHGADSIVGEVMAVVWDDASGKAYCDVYDDTNHVAIPLPVPIGYDSVSSPDVIIGGENVDQTGNIAICYIAKAVNGKCDVFLLFAFETHDYFTGHLSVTTCSTPVNISNSHTVVTSNPPHIGVVVSDFAGRIHVGARGYFVSWTQMNGSSKDIMGFHSWDVSAGVGTCNVDSVTVVNLTDSAGIQGQYADVAGIQTFSAQKGLFTYLDNNGNLNYQEWDATNNTVSTPVHIDNGTIQFPRIDAIDVDSFNAASNGYANYDIVYEYQDPSTLNWDIKSYNNWHGYDCSSGSFTGWTNSLPVVACGPGRLDNPATYLYTIAYCTDQGGTNNIYSQLINWTHGNLVPNSTTYLLVNHNSGAVGPVAISKAQSEYMPDKIFICWYNSTLGEIDFKRSYSPVSYKPSSVATVTNYKQNWHVWPNPATTAITLSTDGDVRDATYNIQDITGRTLQQGNITHNNQQVVIGSLPAGMYLAHIVGNNTAETIKFIKQ